MPPAEPGLLELVWKERFKAELQEEPGVRKWRGGQAEMRLLQGFNCKGKMESKLQVGLQHDSSPCFSVTIYFFLLSKANERHVELALEAGGRNSGGIYSQN